MRKSIQQVADLAQVSPMTVSNVMRGRAKMSEATRRRVLDAARELNYVPVRSTRQNTHIETQIIGLVPYHMDVTQNTIDLQTYSGLYTQAYKRGYDLLIMLRDDAEWMANRQELRFLERRCDGFVFISTGIGEWQPAFEAMVQHKIPTVVCYRRDVPESIAWVDTDNEQIVRLAIEHLLEHGHHRIAYLAAPKVDVHDVGRLARMEHNADNFDDVARRRCFVELMQEYGLADAERYILKNITPGWVLLLDVLMSLRELGATAVISNAYVCLQLWQIIEGAGLVVADDLSLVGIDNTAEGQQRGLTSVAFSYADIGKSALESCINLIQGGDALNNCRIIPVELQKRSSVGAPKS